MEDLALEHPDPRELLLAEAHGRAEHRLAQRALVAELDEPAHDRVEVRHVTMPSMSIAAGIRVTACLKTFLPFIVG